LVVSARVCSIEIGCGNICSDLCNIKESLQGGGGWEDNWSVDFIVSRDSRGSILGCEEQRRERW
jgi:hypothetical protein